MRFDDRVHCLQLSLCLGLALGILGCGGSQTPAPTPPPPSSPPVTLSSAVDTVANQEMQLGIPGMTVALAKEGTILYVQKYGLANLNTNQATDTDTIFEIGSITKQFTAALIMKLQEQGKLHVDDSVDAYLGEYNFPSAITLRMLLTHTSGLANYTSFPAYPNWAANGVSEPTLLTAVSQASLLFQPGTQWSYSNSNYFLLGAIIEKVTGESYEANLEQSIFQPLKLTNTYFSLPPPTQSATGYTLGPTGRQIPALIVNRSAPFAAGALSSNAYDLVAWDNALINGKVVSPASFAAMITPNGLPMVGGGSYGFGLGLRTFNNRPTIWHNGLINGFTAETDVILDSGFAVVVLINSDSADADGVTTKIMSIVCNSAQLSANC